MLSTSYLCIPIAAFEMRSPAAMQKISTYNILYKRKSPDFSGIVIILALVHWASFQDTDVPEGPSDLAKLLSSYFIFYVPVPQTSNGEARLFQITFHMGVQAVVVVVVVGCTCERPSPTVDTVMEKIMNGYELLTVKEIY